MEKKFILAKVNISSNIFEPDYRKLIHLIPDAMRSGFVYRSRKGKYEWEFAEIKEYEIYGLRFISGKFTKSSPLDYKVNINGKVLNEIIPKESKISFFVYEPENELLFFEENSQIQREEFLTSFKNFIFNADYRIGKIEINTIPVKKELEYIISNIQKITSIEFDLVKANGLIEEEDLNSFDRLLEINKSNRIKLRLENSKDGIDKNSEIIQDGIKLASKGYGHVNVSGENEFEITSLPPRSESRGRKRKGIRKEKIRFKSKDHVEKIQISEDTPEQGIINKLAKGIIDFLRRKGQQI
ncbi:hypothetical protein ACWNXI_02900 [Caldibacillus thermoamylovorans]